MHRRILLPFLWLILASVASAQDDNRHDSATLTVQNVVVQEGTPTVDVPITIASENEGQLISALQMSVAIGDPGRDAILIINADQPDIFKHSLWNTHPRTIQVAQRGASGVANLHQITWFEPIEQINVPCDGVVATIKVDTSKLKVGEYRIITNWQGLTSASVITSINGDYLGYHTIVLSHDPGSITIVPRRGGNLNQ